MPSRELLAGPRCYRGIVGLNPPHPATREKIDVIRLCTLGALTVLAGLAVLPQVPASAGTALDKALKTACRGEPVCVVTDNGGGEVALFQRAAEEVLSEGKRLVIDGRCESACVILADIARSNTCLTPRAELAVHQAATVKIIGKTHQRGRAVSVGKVVGRRDPPQSDDINAWVASHGGYPVEGFMTIPLEDARLFWRLCD
jgi:hypothetical protein